MFPDLRTPCWLLLLILASVIKTSSSTLTHWINTIPEYSQLATCAERPLSTIVRGQASGCGMSSSYSCFCTDSSSSISSVITREVMETCAGRSATAAVSAVQAQITSAVLVFDMYCQEGIRDSRSTTSSSAASTTSTAAGATIPSSTPSSTAPTTTSTGNPESAKTSNTTAIAAGVGVPIGVILILVLLFLLRRKWKRSPAGLDQSQQQDKPGHYSELDTQHTHEAPDQRVPQELAGPQHAQLHELGQEHKVHELEQEHKQASNDRSEHIAKENAPKPAVELDSGQ